MVRAAVWIGGAVLAASLAFGTFVAGRGLEQQPAFCASCHEERESYERWERLHVSPATVRNHVQNILGKLGVHSRLEAVVHATGRGLV